MSSSSPSAPLSSAAELSPALLQRICRSLGLYQTAALNDKLYLHYRGFGRIAHLEPYTGLRVLYLEGNALQSLEGLEAQRELRCLYVQENSLESLDSLCALPELSTLNANTNFVACLPAWPLEARLPRLHTLSVSGNRLAAVDALQSLRGHPSLAVLDLQHNRLAAAELDALLGLLASLPQLRVLYLLGNPLLSGVSDYRKRVLAALPALTYLDERPVFDAERRLVAAWQRGGLEAERAERAALSREGREKDRRQWQLFDQLVKQASEHDRPDTKQPQKPASHGGWEEKEQTSAAPDDGLERVLLDEGHRADQASDRQSAVHAWQSRSTKSSRGSQRQEGPSVRLELGASAGTAAMRQGASMLIEVIGDKIDV